MNSIPDDVMSHMTNNFLTVVTTVVVIALLLIATWKTTYRNLAIGWAVTFGFVTISFLYLASHAIVPLSQIILAALSSRMFLLPCLLSACVLYWLRAVHSFAYGLVEVLVGSAVIFFVISQLGEVNAKLIGAVGGIYVVVRGMDNANRGLPIRLSELRQKIFSKSS